MNKEKSDQRWDFPRKSRSGLLYNEVLAVNLPNCAIMRHFLLTLELETELEFDGLLWIVTRAILYPRKLKIFANFLNTIFPSTIRFSKRRGTELNVAKNQAKRLQSETADFLIWNFCAKLSLFRIESSDPSWGIFQVSKHSVQEVTLPN